MSKPTPGPWAVAKHCKTLVVAGDRTIASTGGYTTNAENSKHREENEAHAVLIAAAPDLLAALKRSLDWLASYPGEGAMKAYDQARAAIKKAES